MLKTAHEGKRRFESVRIYYEGSNQSVAVYRSGFMRQLVIWNCPRTNVNAVTLGAEDSPLYIPYDCPIAIRDAASETMRIDGARKLNVAASGNNVMTSITYISHYNASQV